MSIYAFPPASGRAREVEGREASTTAEKVRTWLGHLFRQARVIVEGTEANPATDLNVVAEPKPAVIHTPYLYLPELPDFLQNLRGDDPRGRQARLGICLLFLAGARASELRLATWEQFDLDLGLWVIPPWIA